MQTQSHSEKYIEGNWGGKTSQHEPHIVAPIIANCMVNLTLLNSHKLTLRGRKK